MLQHPLDVLDESHAQHLVRLVEDEGLETLEIERTSLHVVHDASGSAHHDVDAALQVAKLSMVLGSSIDRKDAETFHALTETFDGLSHLNGEFSGGGETENLRFVNLKVESGKQWQGEGGRLARTRLGHSQQIATFREVGNGLSLNGGGSFVTDGLYGLAHGGSQRQVGKG